jgi:hypothetical protein
MKSKGAILAQVQPIVRPIVVHDLAIEICSLATGFTRKESKRKIIKYIKEVEHKRIELLGK